ncbi:hypothetical protein ACA910_022268 [Epithemia clementina (nom. ined.)]
MWCCKLNQKVTAPARFYYSTTTVGAFLATTRKDISHELGIPSIPQVDDYRINKAASSNNGDDPNIEMANALRPYYNDQSSVVLRGCLQRNPHWATALSSWPNRSYLTERIGANEHFDVEIGYYNKGDKVTIPLGQYMEYLKLFESMFGNSAEETVASTTSNKDDWTDDWEDEDKDITQKHQRQHPESSQILYLAQNDLPKGIASDIQIPSLCCDPSFGLGEGKLYQCMFWMGPPYAFSPLHFDPLSNLLIQVVGRKRVLIVDPTNILVNVDTLYVGRDHGQQSNTSAILNLENIDRNQFPLAPPIHLVAQQAVLNPGDVLFIPAKWWHSARSLDFTISVNTWWR